MAESKKKKGWYSGWRKVVVRMLILVIAAGTVFGIGMRQYGWKPLGVSWVQVAKEPGAAAESARDAVVSDAKTAIDSVGERMEKTLEETTDAGELMIDRALGAVGAIRTEAKPETRPAAPKPSGPSEDDREALDRLLKDKGI